MEQGDGGIYYLNLQANSRLPRAMGDIEDALFFATLDASQVGFVISLNNDTRQSIELNISASFVNGIPTDYGTFELGPRFELEIRSSDLCFSYYYFYGNIKGLVRTLLAQLNRQE